MDGCAWVALGFAVPLAYAVGEVVDVEKVSVFGYEVECLELVGDIKHGLDGDGDEGEGGGSEDVAIDFEVVGEYFDVGLCALCAAVEVVFTVEAGNEVACEAVV